MPKIFRSLLLISIASLASCAAPRGSAIAPADAAKLKGASLTTANRNTPSFGTTTVGDAFGVMALGAAGGAVGGGIGAAMLATGGSGGSGLADPAKSVGNALAERLSRKHGMRVVSVSASPVSQGAFGPSAALLASSHAGADYVLDVVTSNWEVVYYPMSPGRCRLAYSANLRLIDTRSKRVVASGMFYRDPKKTDQSPKFSEMSPGAPRLNSELAVAASECLEFFWNDVLGR